MPIDYQRLKNRPFPDCRHTYTARDSMLYALGVGCGLDPLDRSELPFVYEGVDGDELHALPTLGVVLGTVGFWAKEADTGIDWRRVLHGEQGLEIHRPLPAAATVIGRTRVLEILDKGPGKGALMYSQREVFDADSGQPLCTLTMTTVLRGDGGFGGPTTPAPKPHALPDRAPDTAIDLPTLAQAALVYRLSGDFNPLHADPQVAAEAGFARPILHGLATFGVVGRALLRGACGGDPSRLRTMKARFSAPVFPGETIRTELWRDGTALSFRARVVERDLVVLDNGQASLFD